MRSLLKKWLKKDDASVAIEAGLILPLMVAILIGSIDIGMALTANQKVTNACHTIADLLARYEDINNAAFNDSIVAGELVLLPYGGASFGYDVAGVQFNTAALTPVVRWRTTVNMDPNTAVPANTADLGAQNEGVIVVSVKYVYTPYFSSFVVGSIDMLETSIARGRHGGFVTRTNS